MLWVPIAGHVQKEEALRAGVASHQERPPLVEPTIAACTARAHTPFDLQRVVPRFGNSADKSSIPPISVPSFNVFLFVSHIGYLVVIKYVEKVYFKNLTVNTANLYLDKRYLKIVRKSSIRKSVRNSFPIYILLT